MNKQSEWESKILEMTTKINQNYPELSKYINEMPMKFVENNSEEGYLKELKAYHESLNNLINDYSKTHKTMKKDSKTEETEVLPNLSYPASEDIYNQAEEETELNPENPLKKKIHNVGYSTPNEKDFQDDRSGADLDVPGSELDDQQESVGSEDEENNYYSIGGDAHNDLDEDQG